MNTTTIARPNIFRCPNPGCQNALLKLRSRRVTDKESGLRKYGGTFYCCPNAYKGVSVSEGGCDYSVSLQAGKPYGEVYRTHVLGLTEGVETG